MRGCPVTCCAALKEAGLFLCLGASATPTPGSLSLGAGASTPQSFRGSHFASHPPGAVEIGVLCGLVAGNGPLCLQGRGSC